MPPSAAESARSELMPAGIVSARRFLRQTWGPDTPDLITACWEGHDIPKRYSSFHQGFLPLGETLEETLLAMEDVLFEEAPGQGVPERARLVTAWTFLHLPARQQDLVVRSRFGSIGLEHQFFLMDADGKLAPLDLEACVTPNPLTGSEWSIYRRAVEAACEGTATAQAVAEALEHLTESPEMQAPVQAWLAHLARIQGSDPRQICRHAALALEFAPHCRLAMLERAQSTSPRDLQDATDKLHRFYQTHLDEEPQSAFLLVQSLAALQQLGAAQLLCNLLAARGRRFAEALEPLRRTLDQRQRGAQT